MDLDALLHAHAFMTVERPPLLWSPDTEDEPFLRMLGEMIALGLGRGNELEDLTLNVSNVVVEPDEDDEELEWIPDGEHVAIAVRGAGAWDDDTPSTRTRATWPARLRHSAVAPTRSSHVRRSIR